jgi:hypothetical protein
LYISVQSNTVDWLSVHIDIPTLVNWQSQKWILVKII